MLIQSSFTVTESFAVRERDLHDLDKLLRANFSTVSYEVGQHLNCEAKFTNVDDLIGWIGVGDRDAARLCVLGTNGGNPEEFALLVIDGSVGHKQFEHSPNMLVDLNLPHNRLDPFRDGLTNIITSFVRRNTLAPGLFHWPDVFLMIGMSYSGIWIFWLSFNLLDKRIGQEMPDLTLISALVLPLLFYLVLTHLFQFGDLLFPVGFFQIGQSGRGWRFQRVARIAVEVFSHLILLGIFLGVLFAFDTWY